MLRADYGGYGGYEGGYGARAAPRGKGTAVLYPPHLVVSLLLIHTVSSDVLMAFGKCFVGVFSLVGSLIYKSSYYHSSDLQDKRNLRLLMSK